MSILLTFFYLLDCKCSYVGASSEQCNVNGYCLCKDLFYGPKCRECIHGYYFNLIKTKCIGEKFYSRLWWPWLTYVTVACFIALQPLNFNTRFCQRNLKIWQVDSLQPEITLFAGVCLITFFKGFSLNFMQNYAGKVL